MNNEKYFIIIPAAGIGQRFANLQKRTSIYLPKQYAMIDDKTVLEYVLMRFSSCDWVDEIVLALNEQDTYFEQLNVQISKPLTVVTGGETRAHSVFNALKVIHKKASASDWVLVHDAARPCLSLFDLQNLKEQLQDHEVGGLLAERMTATVKQAQENDQVYRTLNRERLWQALTPQMFRNEILYTGLKYCLEKKQAVTDESQAVEYLGLVPKLIEARDYNIKITTQNDLHLTRVLIKDSFKKTAELDI